MGVEGVKNPTITVAIPTFNRLSFLKKTIASVQNQTLPPDEILIIDNHSADGTWESLKGLKGIKTIRNSNNIGAIKNYNLCLRKAKSEYVTALASDDIILPNFIEKWKSIITKTPKACAAFTSAGYIIDEKDRIKGLVRPFSKDIYLPYPQGIKFFWKYLYFTLPLSGWTVFKKDIFRKVGYYSYISRAEEADMTLKILREFPVYYCATPLFAYRIHPQQAFVYQVGDANRNNYIAVPDYAAKILFSYEKDPKILRAFTNSEQKKREYIRKPIMYFLISAAVYAFQRNSTKAKAFLKLFHKYYPRPYFTGYNMYIIMLWLKKLVLEEINNLLIRGRKLEGRQDI